MIRYSLICEDGHSFDSWFQSADAFDALAARSLVTCAQCGTARVTKTLMAPAVRTLPKSDAAPLAASEPPTSEMSEKLLALRRHVEENADYVGLSFATEARAMHDGDVPERAIYGEARLDEARKLIEDGIPVAPLPFLPKRHAN